MGGSALETTPDTIRAIERSAHVEEIRRAVRDFASPFGYDRFVLYAAPPSGPGLIERLLWIEGNWFDAGERHIDAETYLAHCPVNRHVLETDRAFFWTKLRRNGLETYRIVRHPHGSGVHGIQVPVFGHVGLMGSFSAGGIRIASSTDVQLAMGAIAPAAFRTMALLLSAATDKPASSLSRREQEILRWVASGRRQADIALQLGLSERTIENHLRRIRKRLGVSSTAQAVHVAVRVGLLDDPAA
ncbi:PA1136 family autoinducer-binding transcriptional regulator [Aureimonas altamirensis]|uniref:PA1136 family autoinducer-binding transcriptional regulator n=1 Tax=Aureimonas altamirensis TaxID=370622 RepID=UPI00068EA082|nr:PA1136 family autoinducer-binding transcriptional regulator [Aureimonas altamirensis]